MEVASITCFFNAPKKESFLAVYIWLFVSLKSTGWVFEKNSILINKKWSFG